MFVFINNKDIIVLLVYVDDILLTGNSPSMLDSFIASLKTEFATKELGNLGYFLGIEAVRDSDTLVLTQ